MDSMGSRTASPWPNQASQGTPPTGRTGAAKIGRPCRRPPSALTRWPRSALLLTRREVGLPFGKACFPGHHILAVLLQLCMIALTGIGFEGCTGGLQVCGSIMSTRWLSRASHSFLHRDAFSLVAPPCSVHALEAAQSAAGRK